MRMILCYVSNVVAITSYHDLNTLLEETLKQQANLVSTKERG